MLGFLNPAGDIINISTPAINALRPPTIVPVDNIQVQSNLTGAPTNVGVQNIPSALNINVDVKTPALSMMYLIRAY